MPKGQHLSRYQKKIVDRYYEHRDTISIQKLSELVSEIYLATGEKQQQKMWKSVETALNKTPADAARVARILATRDVKELARLVTDLSQRSG